MFTLVAYSETITSQNVTENIAAVADPHVRVSGDNIAVPALNKLLGYFAIGLTDAVPRLVAPSLKRLAEIEISPVELSDLPVSPPDPIIKGESLIALEEDEFLSTTAQNSSATDAILRTLVWLSDDNVSPVKGQIFTIRSTISVTATAETWSNAQLTISQSLPKGEYDLVGARCVDAAGIAFRFVFIGGTWRPGMICVPAESSLEVPYSRAGLLGVWGTFRHDQPPSVDVLRNAAGSTATIYLDIIKK